MVFPYVPNYGGDWKNFPDTSTPITEAVLDNLETQFASVIALLTTRGDIIYRGAATWERLAKGTNGQFLSMGANDPAWASIGGHYTILPHAYQSIGQGTWALATDADQFLQGYIYNSTTNDGDELDYNVYLPAGTYTLRILTEKNTDLGVLDVDIDAGEVASEDLYAAGPSKNYSMSQTNIAVATSSLKAVTLRVDGKHGSSSDFIARISSISFWRTA